MARSTVDEELSQAKRLQPWVLVLAILGAAMASAEIISGSMLPLIASGLNTTEGMAGQAVTATAIVAIITSLSIGKIVGNHDRRLMLIILTCFLVASNIGVGLAPNIWFLLAARLLLGAAIGIIWGLIPAIVLRLAPKGQFARSFATVMIGVAAASVVGAPASAYIGEVVSWRVVYLGATALAVLALVLLVLVFPPLPARPGALDRDLKGTLRLPGMVIGMFAIMLLFGGAQTFYGYMVPFLNDITGLNATAVSFTLLMLGISGLFGTISAPRTLSKSIYGVMVIAPASLAILLWLMLSVRTLAIPVVLVLMLWSFARAHMGVGVNAWIADSFAENVEGAGGILVAVIQGSMMLGAILGGLLIDNTGATAPPIAGAIIIGVGALFSVWALRPASVDALGEELASPIISIPPAPLVVQDEPA